jgi:hypothetical protein
MRSFALQRGWLLPSAFAPLVQGRTDFAGVHKAETEGTRIRQAPLLKTQR